MTTAETAVTRAAGTDDDYWAGFCDGLLSAREEALTEGYLLGRREAWSKAWSMTVELLGPVYVPQTPFVATEHPKPALRLSECKSRTGAQLVAEARWSWSKVERAIAEQAQERRISA